MRTAAFDCCGEQSRKGPLRDPPSSGPFRFCGHPAGTLAPWSRRSSSPRRAATAPGSSARSRRSRRRSTCTARRSTSASRSSTTCTSSGISRRAARSSSTRRPRCPKARPSSSPRTGSRRRCTRTPQARQLSTIDATCPLVTKVHVQARRYAADGYTVVLIGHAGHEEVVGTMGEAPESMVLVESVEDVERLTFSPDARLAYVTQTTLSVDETGEIIAALRERFPTIYAPKKEDICYATSNRQWAVKEMLNRDRAAARDRLAQLVELEPARRGGPRRRRRRPPDRRRDRDRRAAGSTGSRSSASPRAPRRPRSSSSGSATGSARAA